MGGSRDNLARLPWEVGYPSLEEITRDAWKTQEKNTTDIIEETVAAVFVRERLYREYDRLTAEWDRRNRR